MPDVEVVNGGGAEQSGFGQVACEESRTETRVVAEQDLGQKESSGGRGLDGDATGAETAIGGSKNAVAFPSAPRSCSIGCGGSDDQQHAADPETVESVRWRWFAHLRNDEGLRVSSLQGHLAKQDQGEHQEDRPEANEIDHAAS